MQSNKIKIQIKHRGYGSVIFEYESEDNTLKKTILEAVSRNVSLCNADLSYADLRNADLRDANLCNANLCGANLCNANLRNADLSYANLCNANLRNADLSYANLFNAFFLGAVIDYSDDPGEYSDTDKLLKKIRENSTLRPTVVYENHDAYSSAHGCFWKNLIIIREWAIAEKNEVKVELSEEEKQAIKAFAKMYKTESLMHVTYIDFSYFYAPDCDDDLEKDLDMPSIIEGLESGRVYTLADLGIE